MIGVPLFCLSVANLSTSLSDLFRKAFFETAQFFKRSCCNKKQKTRPSDENSTISKEINHENKGIINPNFGAEFITKNSKLNNVAFDSDDEESDDYEKIEEKQQIRIPLAIAITILAAYNSIGALVFNRTEADWSKTQAAYFSFITMATIGKYK